LGCGRNAVGILVGILLGGGEEQPETSGALARAGKSRRRMMGWFFGIELSRSFRTEDRLLALPRAGKQNNIQDGPLREQLEDELALGWLVSGRWPEGGGKRWA